LVTPEQIELDVVIKNGKVIAIEIKAAAGRSDVYYFDRKVAFYARKTGRQVNRKLMVTPYADNRARETGVRLGVRDLYRHYNSGMSVVGQNP
jgi:hypothetical protein